MYEAYKPEGARLGTPENRDYLSSPMGLERAMNSGAIVEGIVTLCDNSLCLHVDLHCAYGIIPPEEALFCRRGEDRKDIALISRVGKPVAFQILALENRGGVLTAILSRRLAQKRCLQEYLSTLRQGDIIPARVTHLEPFGAFLDIGCGISSLLSVDCISVSRISHPRDRLRPGMELFVAVKSIEPDSGRIYVSLRELLGTWEENAASFEAGQTVAGVIRSVESYGVFVELTPNLAGLAELRSGTPEDMRARIGQNAAVYIKSMVPERMKIKLVLIDTCCADAVKSPLRYYVDPTVTAHMDRWIYSPAASARIIETRFDQVG